MKTVRKMPKKYSWQSHYKGAIVYKDFRYTDTEVEIEENLNPSSRDFGKVKKTPMMQGYATSLVYGISPLIPSSIVDEIYQTALNAQFGRKLLLSTRKKEEKEC